jgi:hypothetical protein
MVVPPAPGEPTGASGPSGSTPTVSAELDAAPEAARSLSRDARPPVPSPAPSSPDLGGDTGPSPCGPFPSVPDETCTGWRYTGVELRPCPNEITESGVTLDGCLFENGLEVDAANVTITRSRIEGVIQPHGDLQNLKLVDVEIDGTGRLDPNAETAIGNSNYSCIRCHVHGTGRGARMGNNVHIEDSYFHGFPFQEGFHKTAIGANGGGNYTVIHNNLECSVSGCSAALSLYGDFAPIHDVLIMNNLFNTTGSYCTYGGSVSSKPYPDGTNIRYIDNLFGKKYHSECGIYGPVTSWDSQNEGNVWEGNRWQDGSGPVTP